MLSNLDSILNKRDLPQRIKRIWNKRSHTIAENLKLYAPEMVKLVCDLRQRKKIKVKSLSNDVIHSEIGGIFSAILKQVMEEFSATAVSFSMLLYKTRTDRSEGSDFWFPSIMCIPCHSKNKNTSILRTSFGHFKSNQYLWNGKSLFVKQNFNHASQPFPIMSLAHTENRIFVR